MKNFEEVIAEACRVEKDDETNRVFIVFEVKNEKFKQRIMKEWVNDLEFKLINRKIILNEK